MKVVERLGRRKQEARAGLGLARQKPPKTATQRRSSKRCTQPSN